jgi:glucose-6-phosphate 1-dehydrogenase
MKETLNDKNGTVEMNMNDIDLSSTLVIFGGTGDLAHRKLLPAIYNLAVEGLLPDAFNLVAVGRRKQTTDAYRTEIYEAVSTYSRFKMDEAIWNLIKNKIYYYEMDFTKEAGYVELNQFLTELEQLKQTSHSRIYYLAVSPDYFEVIVDHIHLCFKDQKQGSQRVVIEKPFGKDLASAKQLNDKIVSVFQEENTYRIDHYLGKEMLQNIMVIRFANSLFEPIWNNQYIEQVQITSNETLGVETRGQYYETSGAIRDMVQSHLLQLLSLIAMDRPYDLGAESIRDKKVKVLSELRPLAPAEIQSHVVRGQYAASASGDLPSYRDEDRVNDESNTETYVALKVLINNPKWDGVPFYIRTGKRMTTKSTEIVIEFKQPNHQLYRHHDIASNRLTIKVQPMEGVQFQFNAKRPGNISEIIPVDMDFCQNCQVGINSPEAYERLLHDVMRGDATLFTRWDEVLHSWKYIDAIIESWKDEATNFPNYLSQTYGPVEADDLLARDGKSWINI